MKKLIIKRSIYFLLLSCLIFISFKFDLAKEYNFIYSSAFIIVLLALAYSFIRFVKTEAKFLELYKKQETSNQFDIEGINRLNSKLDTFGTFEGWVLFLIGVFFSGLTVYHFFPIYFPFEGEITGMPILGFLICVVYFIFLIWLAVNSGPYENLNYKIKEFTLSNEEVKKLLKSGFLEQIEALKGFNLAVFSFNYIKILNGENDNNENWDTIPSPVAIANNFKIYLKKIEVDFKNYLNYKDREELNKIKEQKRLEKIAACLNA